MSEPITRIKTPVRLEYKMYPGTHYSKYLRALAEGRIIGGRCPESKKVYVPPRGASPTSGLPTDEIVEVKDVGVLTTFCVIRIAFPGQKMTPPYCFGAIVLDGADMPIYHLVSGCPLESVRMGMRLRARWKPEELRGPTLESISFFEPTFEPDAAFESYAEHL